VAQSQLESAQALVKQSEVSLKSANDNLQRMSDLFAKGAVTRVQLDAAKTQADIAKAQYQSTQATLESAKAGLDGARKGLSTAKDSNESQTALQAQMDAAESQYHMTEANVKAAEARLTQIKAGARVEDVQAAQAQVQQADAAVDLAKSQLGNAVITAPISGVVASRAVDPGEMTSPGLPVFTIVNTAEVYADVSLTEGLIGKVTNGENVEVAVDAYPGRIFTGRLTNLSPVADPRTRAFSGRIRLANKDGQLKPGMFAAAKFATESHKNAVLIPADAVVDRNGDQIVFVVQKATSVERTIKTGIGDGRSVEVLSGLSQGEQLVVAGQTQLADGVAVQVQNEVK
jgi:RND family efflux transporter MFP subunit